MDCKSDIKNSKKQSLINIAIKNWEYCSHGVWSDTRKSWVVDLIKTLNLSIASFLDKGIQSRAAALTYKTLLAIVPLLALIFAIGRGFGFQNIIESQFMSYFPAQQNVVETALTMVDSYLKQSSEGWFLGIGIVMLLWTLISLLMNVEQAFNMVWGIKRGRGIWRKISDYTAIFMILPILMICSSGLSIFVSSVLQNALQGEFLTPAIMFGLKVAKYVFTWLLFAGVYMLIPNTKVKFKNALIAGVLAGSAFILLQWMFMSGQVSVSKYNAVYGSFAFIPLLLIWIHFSWVVCLAGAIICYSSQNIFRFSFSNEIKNISTDYRRRVTLIVMAVIVKRFCERKAPLEAADFNKYGLPPRLVADVVEDLVEAGMVSKVVIDEDKDPRLQPAVDVSNLTLGEVIKALDATGHSDFVTSFNDRFSSVIKAIDDVTVAMYDVADNTLIKDLDINLHNN